MSKVVKAVKKGVDDVGDWGSQAVKDVGTGIEKGAKAAYSYSVEKPIGAVGGAVGSVISEAGSALAPIASSLAPVAAAYLGGGTAGQVPNTQALYERKSGSEPVITVAPSEDNSKMIMWIAGGAVLIGGLFILTKKKR